MFMLAAARESCVSKAGACASGAAKQGNAKQKLDACKKRKVHAMQEQIQQGHAKQANVRQGACETGEFEGAR